MINKAQAVVSRVAAAGSVAVVDSDIVIAANGSW